MATPTPAHPVRLGDVFVGEQKGRNAKRPIRVHRFGGPRRRRGFWFRCAFILLWGLVGASAAAVLFSKATYPVGPFRLNLYWDFASHGVTQFIFPPLGEVSAPTHWGPTRVTALLERIDLDELGALVNAASESQQVALAALSQEATRVLRWFAARLVTLGVLGGASALFLAQRIRGRAPTFRGVLGAAFSGGLFLAVLVGTAYVSYDTDAFRRPVYKGALESLPWVIETVQDGLARVEELESRLRVLSRHVYRMYHRVESLQPPVALTDADVAILHVTDFHNHPAAGEIALEIAKAFAVDFVINTGDLTDFGTELEADLLRGLSSFEVPHYLVTGNHESPEVVRLIVLRESIRLLDGREVVQSGLRIVGIGDPGAASPSPESLSPGDARRIGGEAAGSFAVMERPPDVVAVHNFRVAQAIPPGLVPLIVFGHSHTPGVTFSAGTAYVNAGTTGGAGVRGLETEDPVRISLAVIYMQKAADAARVVAVDMLRLSPVAGGFTLERHLAPID